MDALDYSNVQLVPRKCVVSSRQECDTSVEFGGRKFQLPIVPANMRCILDQNLAEILVKSGVFYIMHRFDVDSLEFTREMHEKNMYASISVGIKPESYDLIDNFKKKKVYPEYITIDVAHGHSDYVAKMLRYIKKNLPNTFVIVGNICTASAAIFLKKNGADSIKIGVGPGKACITKLKTGFGNAGWPLSSMKNCYEATPDIPFILDGGMEQNGDIAKSVAFGARLCMLGYMLSGHDENPGKKKAINGAIVKEYYGSASEYNKGDKKNIEGRMVYVDYKGSIKDKFEEIKQDLQSAISYAGGKDLSALRKVDFVKIDK